MFSVARAGPLLMMQSRRGAALLSSKSFPAVADTFDDGVSSMDQTRLAPSSPIVSSLNPLSWKVSNLLGVFSDISVWNMSSTLKKRRAKMNKHKLRKRRKKERLKSKR